ncbi:MAG: hypothetical protein ABH869_07710 [Candidatus Omnitrophota bacterium]
MIYLLIRKLFNGLMLAVERGNRNSISEDNMKIKEKKTIVQRIGCKLSKLCENSKGMCLIEAIVSTGLVGIVTMSMVGAVSQSTVFTKSVDVFYLGTHIAQRRVEVLKRMDFDLLESNAETDIRVSSDGNIDPNGKYFRTTEITANYDNNTDLKKVKVTVKRIRLDMCGTIAKKDTDELDLVHDPIVMETLFVNFE